MEEHHAHDSRAHRSDAHPDPVGRADGQMLRGEPSSTMLATMAPPVRTLGTSRVKPSVYLSPMAQQTSSSPAMTRRIQDMTYDSCCRVVLS